MDDRRYLLASRRHPDNSIPEHALEAHGDTRPQILLYSYVGLLFNFNYGIQILDVTDFQDTLSAIAEHGQD